MITTVEQTRAELKRLGFPDIFERITRWETNFDQDIPDALVGTCEPVKVFYKVMPHLVEHLPVSENYLPLWEWNGEAVVAYDQRRDIFVRYYYGDMSDETLGTTYQQFLSAVLLEVVKQGIEGEELEEVARLFEYKHLDMLRAFASSVDPNDYEDANRRFIASIPD